MQLKPDFITMAIDDATYVVPTARDAWRGIAQGNETAGFIIECLKQPTTEAAVVDALCAAYDAPRDTVAADVAEILDTLRSIGAIEE